MLRNYNYIQGIIQLMPRSDTPCAYVSHTRQPRLELSARGVRSRIMNATTALNSLPLVRDQASASVVSTTKMESRLAGSARVLADGVIRAGRFGPVLACVEHLRLAVIHFASDRTGEYVAGDEGGIGMVMRRRCAARWIVDDNRGPVEKLIGTRRMPFGTRRNHWKIPIH